MAEQQNQPEYVYAFWPYDRFPYVGSGVGYQIEPGVMMLDGYGRWGMGSMFAFQPETMGKATHEKLKKLEADYDVEQWELLKKYKAKALEILPALAATKAYGGNIR